MEESGDSCNTIGSLKLAPTVTLAGKVALVTGGARGIGRAVCEALLENKGKVCVTDVDVTEGSIALKELVKTFGEENVMFAKCDVTSEEEFETVIQATKEKFGHFDILINNAGIGGEDNWEKLIDTNLKGVMRGTMLAMRHLVDKDGIRGGTVINTGSILGLRLNPLAPAYCAAKHGVVGWSQCWGTQSNVDDTNVKVNVVCPLAVDTLLFNKCVEFSINKTKAKKTFEFLRSQSMSPSTAAEAYIKILEDGVTAAVLVVDPNGSYYHTDKNTF